MPGGEVVGRDAVLVIGAGQIGTAIAQELRDQHDVVLHCRRASSVRRASEETGVSPDRCWHGDLLAVDNPMTKLSDGSPATTRVDDSRDVESRVSARLEQLVDASGARLVVDATNVATSSADLWNGAERSSPASWSMDVAAGVVRGRALTLHRLLRAGRVERYVRISTTGLASRGLELPFTHGDGSDGMMSAGLWAKLFFAGMEHQALWALARSFPGRVAVVVPAAFVGFEGFDALVDAISDGRPPESGTVAAGEDRAYTAEEVAVASSRLQFGALTTAEVARSTRAVLGGSTRFDLLEAMSAHAIRPSAAGAAAREHIVAWLRDAPSDLVASGALGHRTTQALVALRSLRQQWPGPVRGWFDPGTAPLALDLEALRRAAPPSLQVVADHQDTGRITLCVCSRCSWARRERVVARLAKGLHQDDGLRRVELARLLDDDGPVEGDILAILWHADGAEEDFL